MSIASRTEVPTGTATMSILGVITSLTAISSSCITFDITWNSSSSMAPSRRPISVRASISARLIVTCRARLGLIQRLR